MKKEERWEVYGFVEREGRREKKKPFRLIDFSLCVYRRVKEVL